MDTPILFGTRTVAPDTEAIASFFPIPTLGMVPVNAFLIRARQPVLIDTGVPALRTEFLRHLRSLIDLEDLRWLWLTHLHADHTGSLAAILAEAPNVRVVTTFLGMGMMQLQQFPIDRVYLLNPGQALDLGDRRLRCVRPPTFDSPETTAAFDEKTRAFFCSDSFGALVQAPVETARDLSPATLTEGMVTWATIDSPWLPLMRSDLLDGALAAVAGLEPSVILGSHLPAAEGMTERLITNLKKACTVEPFRGPDQAALEELMARQ